VEKPGWQIPDPYLMKRLMGVHANSNIFIDDPLGNCAPPSGLARALVLSRGLLVPAELTAYL
jgi:hypothetical protein